MRRLKSVAVIGVGLIGGSFALAVRRAGLATSLVGFDRDTSALQRAIELGVIDRAAESASDAARGAELVMVAVPVRAIGPVLHDVALALDADAVVTDAGSTKEEVVRLARAELRERFARFVPGHPIAGRETSGVESATAELFRGARVVLTPVAETASGAVTTVRSLWEGVGARVATSAADVHDRVFAAVSHLPHVLSFALVSEIASRPDSDELLDFAGGGFRDFTRIAQSDAALWGEILSLNGKALSGPLNHFSASLARLARVLEEGDSESLERILHTARQRLSEVASGAAAEARVDPKK